MDKQKIYILLTIILLAVMYMPYSLSLEKALPADHFTKYDFDKAITALSKEAPFFYKTYGNSKPDSSFKKIELFFQYSVAKYINENHIDNIRFIYIYRGGLSNAKVAYVISETTVYFFFTPNTSVSNPNLNPVQIVTTQNNDKILRALNILKPVAIKDEVRVIFDAPLYFYMVVKNQKVKSAKYLLAPDFGTNFSETYLKPRSSHDQTFENNILVCLQTLANQAISRDNQKLLQENVKGKGHLYSYLLNYKIPDKVQNYINKCLAE